MSEQQLSLDESGKGEDAKVEISATELEQIRSDARALGTKLQASQIAQARLEEQAKQATAAPVAPTILTREQLQAAVDEGTITQTQADTETARQMREELRTELTKDLRAEQAATQQQTALQAEFDRYVEARPDLKVDGSVDLATAMSEVAALVKLGHPNTLLTEVTALRKVFGPSERIVETTRQTRETHQESVGVGNDPAGKGGSGWKKGLTGRQIAAFDAELGKKGSQYKGEDDPFFLRVVTRARTKTAARAA